MKAHDLRSKNTEDLQSELLALLKEQFNLRMQRGIGQPAKPHLFKRVKTSIAQVKTLLKEKGVQV